MNGRFERKWSSAAVEATLIAIAESDLATPYASVLRPPLIPYLTLYTRTKTDPALKRLFDVAVGIRKERKAKERAARKLQAVRAVVGDRAAAKDASAARRREKYRRYTAEQIAEVADLIRDGSSIKDAFATVAPGVNKNSHRSFFKREPELKQIIDDAVAYRESTDRAIGRPVYVKRSYTESDWSAALSAVAFANGRPLRSVLVPPLIPYMTVFMRVQRDEAFAARYRSAVAEYRAGRRLKHSKQHKKDASDKLSFASEALRSSLQMDDLYREVSALFQPGLPDRDDMISEVVVAVMEGDLAREDIAKLGPKIGWAFASRMNDKRMDALDRPIGFDGSGALLVDTITADQWDAI